MIKIKNITPVGVDLDNILKLYVVLLGVSVCTSFHFFEFIELLNKYQEQTTIFITQKQLLSSMLEHLGFFPFIFVWCICLVGYHYFYHFHGCKSIYLMKRLPQKGEFLKRIIALPIFLFCLTILLMTGYMLLYYQIYLIVIENISTEVNLWEIILNHWLEGG